MYPIFCSAWVCVVCDVFVWWLTPHSENGTRNRAIKLLDILKRGFFFSTARYDHHTFPIRCFSVGLLVPSIAGLLRCPCVCMRIGGVMCGVDVPHLQKRLGLGDRKSATVPSPGDGPSEAATRVRYTSPLSLPPGVSTQPHKIQHTIQLCRTRLFSS